MIDDSFSSVIKLLIFCTILTLIILTVQMFDTLFINLLKIEYPSNSWIRNEKLWRFSFSLRFRTDFLFGWCSLFNAQNLNEVRVVIKLYVILHQTNPASESSAERQAAERLKCNNRRASILSCATKKMMKRWKKTNNFYYTRRFSEWISLINFTTRIM